VLHILDGSNEAGTYQYAMCGESEFSFEVYRDILPLGDMDVLIKLLFVPLDSLVLDTLFDGSDD
jgi:hypothetical protein